MKCRFKTRRGGTHSILTPREEKTNHYQCIPLILSFPLKYYTKSINSLNTILPELLTHIDKSFNSTRYTKVMKGKTRIYTDSAFSNGNFLLVKTGADLVTLHLERYVNVICMKLSVVTTEKLMRAHYKEKPFSEGAQPLS